MNIEKLLRNKYLFDQLIIRDYPSKAKLREKIADWYYNSGNFDKVSVSDKTINRDFKDVEMLFGVNVKYSPIEKGYYIEESEYDLNIYDALDSLNLYYISRNVPNALKYIQFSPRRATGTNYFFDIIKAIENKKKIEFIYAHYEKKSDTIRTVSPLGLKEFKGFWYLISIDTKDDKIKNFGLDRISGLHQIDEKSAISKNFNMEKHFEHCYGIVNFSDEAPQEVLIKMKPIKGAYYKANPLHTSQEVIEETEDYTIVSLFIKFTYDLKQELRSHAKGEVELLKPQNGLEGEERYY